jgi:hypothetical protein
MTENQQENTDMNPEQEVEAQKLLTPEFYDFAAQMAEASAAVGAAIEQLADVYQRGMKNMNNSVHENAAALMCWHLIYSLRKSYEYNHQQLSSISHMAMMLQNRGKTT